MKHIIVTILGILTLNSLSVFARNEYVPVKSISVKPLVLPLIWNTARLVTVEILPANASNQNFKVISEDPEIAQFLYAEGSLKNRVKGVGGGETELTFICEDNPEIKCTIIARVQTNVPVLKELKTIPEMVEIAVGRKSAPIKVTPIPAGAYKSVTWSVTDPKIACVDENGVITGLTQGETTALGTSTVDKTISAKVKVKVTEYISLEAVHIKSGYVAALNSIFDLPVEYIPDNATDKKIKWESGNPHIIQIEEGTGRLIAKSLGMTCLKAIHPQDNRIKGTCTVEVKRTSENASLWISDDYREKAQIELRVINYKKDVNNIVWMVSKPGDEERKYDKTILDLYTGKTRIKCIVTYNDGEKETIIKNIMTRQAK